MRSKKIQFFSTKKEIIDSLVRMQRDFDLLCYVDNQERLEAVTLDTYRGDCRVQLYLSERSNEPKAMRELFSCGGVQVDLGAQFVEKIELSQVAIIQGAPDSLYKKISYELKKMMTFPMVGKNIMTNAVEIYKNIGITNEALGLARRGVLLTQRGVDNIIFCVK